MLLHVCLFACTAGLLYILLTGIKAFWCSGAKMRREEGSGVNRKEERVTVQSFTLVCLHILALFAFHIYCHIYVLLIFMLLGLHKNVTL